MLKKSTKSCFFILFASVLLLSTFTNINFLKPLVISEVNAQYETKVYGKRYVTCPDGTRLPDISQCPPYFGPPIAGAPYPPGVDFRCVELNRPVEFCVALKAECTPDGSGYLPPTSRCIEKSQKMHDEYNEMMRPIWEKEKKEREAAFIADTKKACLSNGATMILNVALCNSVLTKDEKDKLRNDCISGKVAPSSNACKMSFKVSERLGFDMLNKKYGACKENEACIGIDHAYWRQKQWEKLQAELNMLRGPPAGAIVFYHLWSQGDPDALKKAQGVSNLFDALFLLHGARGVAPGGTPGGDPGNPPFQAPPGSSAKDPKPPIINKRPSSLNPTEKTCSTGVKVPINNLCPNVFVPSPLPPTTAPIVADEFGQTQNNPPPASGVDLNLPPGPFPPSTTPIPESSQQPPQQQPVTAPSVADELGSQQGDTNQLSKPRSPHEPSTCPPYCQPPIKPDPLDPVIESPSIADEFGQTQNNPPPASGVDLNLPPGPLSPPTNTSPEALQQQQQPPQNSVTAPMVADEFGQTQNNPVTPPQTQNSMDQ